MFNNRYSRQVLFRSIGREGQAKLGQARVAVVGMGALGTVLATQLVRAGVGMVRLIDRDIIEETNLQRQSLYDETDALEGQAKAVAAAEKLRKGNSEVVIETFVEDLTWRNAESLLSDVDVILDGADNFQVRYLMNDVSVKHGIAFAYGGAVSSYGMAAFLRPGLTPCLRCLMGPNEGTTNHDTCDTVGVIAPVVSIVASVQVAETLKYLTGNYSALSNALFQVDVWNNDFQMMAISGPAVDCPVCAMRNFAELTSRPDGLTVSFCGRQTIQVRPPVGSSVSLPELAARLGLHGVVKHNANLLRYTSENANFTLFADGRALFHGIEDEVAARSLYARYIGM